MLLAACGPTERHTVESEHAPGPDPPQRILLITIDTLRADRVGFGGYPRTVTPNLDQMAEQSIVFERAYSSIAHTAPSHATMFTGLQPAQHGLLENGTTLDPRVVTLSEHLGALGFRTAAFTPVRFLSGLSQGFDEFAPSEGYEKAPDLLARAERWIEAAEPADRLFVWIHLFDVHQWFVDHLVDQGAARRLRQSEPLTGALAEHLRDRQGLMPADDPSGGAQQMQNRYDAQIVSVDGALGRFFDRLRERDLDQRSLWIVTSDHGEGLGNHGARGHGHHVYEELLRVPLLFHLPDQPAWTGRVDTTVRLVDLAPTIADLTESSMTQVVPPSGRSLVPLLAGADVEWDEMVFSQRRPVDEHRLSIGWQPGEIQGLQTRTQKLVAHSDGAHEFFDLERDPLELDNRFDGEDPVQRALYRELTARYRRMADQGEPYSAGGIEERFLDELRALGYVGPEEGSGVEGDR